jgi:hypothetical protein
MTTIVPVRRCWTDWLRLYYSAVGRGLLPRPSSLTALSMIGFARWSLIDRIPAGSSSRAARLATPYLLFESNFNGESNHYLEAFALITPWGLRANWGGAYGFPDVRRVSRFQRYVNERNLPPSYYFCGYPDASTKSIRIGLALQRQIQDFNSATIGMGPEQFHDAYWNLVTDVQALRNPANQPGACRSAEGLTVITPIHDGSAARLEPVLERLSEGPTPVPDGTHFARWVLVPGLERPRRRAIGPPSYVLFSTWFDRPAREYLDELHRCLGDRAQTIWRPCGWEGDDPASLRDYLLRHRVKPSSTSSSTFRAYERIPVDQAREAASSVERFRALAACAQGMRPDELRSAWSSEFG